MNFLKPNKLSLIIVVFLYSFLGSWIVGTLFNLSSSSAHSTSPNIIEVIAILYYYVFVDLIFELLRMTGLNVGSIVGAWFTFVSPNILGWVLISIIDIFIFYLWGCLVSFVVRNETKRKLLFYFFLSLTVIYLITFAAVTVPATKEDRRSAACSNQCLPPAEKAYTACLDTCHASFPEWASTPSGRMPEAYRSCEKNCETSRDDLVRQCNSRCLAK